MSPSHENLSHSLNFMKFTIIIEYLLEVENLVITSLSNINCIESDNKTFSFSVRLNNFVNISIHNCFLSVLLLVHYFYVNHSQCNCIQILTIHHHF